MIDDREVERVAAQAGARAAATLDVERVAAQVLARLRRGEHVATPVHWPRLLAAAATVVVLVGGTLVWRGAEGADPRPVRAAAPVALDDLEPLALVELLDSLTAEASVRALLGAPGLDDLDERQLRELLADMEG